MTRSHRDNLSREFLRVQRECIDALRAGRLRPSRRLLLQLAEILYRMAAQLEGSQRARRLTEAAELVSHAQRLAARNQAGRRTEERDRKSPTGGSGKNYRLGERPEIRFDDVAGLEAVKEQIRLRLVYPFRHPEKAKRYGLRGGGGLLLFGPPGTGKTLLARAVAGEVDAAFFTVKPSEILSKWVGEAEKNVEDLFETARAEPISVIFVDEIDALAPRRSESSSPVMARLVPQILAEMEGFHGDGDGALLFLGATNEPWLLDPALLRPGRFDEMVYVGLPDLPARREILAIHLRGRPLATDVDLDDLAVRLDGYSGADIRRVCEDAAASVFLEAVHADTELVIDRKDLERAIERVTPSVTPTAARKYEQYAAETGISLPPTARDGSSGAGRNAPGGASGGGSAERERDARAREP